MNMVLLSAEYEQMLKFSAQIERLAGNIRINIWKIMIANVRTPR